MFNSHSPGVATLFCTRYGKKTVQISSEQNADALKIQANKEGETLKITLLIQYNTSSVRRPSCGRISKTEQDRPIVTMAHYIADSVAAHRPFLDAPLGRYSGFKHKICAHNNTASCLTGRHTTAVVNRARPYVVSLAVSSTVVN